MNTRLQRALQLAIVSVIIFSFFVFPQESAGGNKLKEVNELTYKALVMHDKSMLLKANSIYSETLNADKTNQQALYGLAFTGYRLLEFSLEKENDSLFDKFYQVSINDAEALSKISSCESDGKAILAGIYMMKIAKNPMSAVTLSADIYALLDEAENANPANPTLFIIRGEMRYNTPKMFGGSFEDAAKNFNKAVAACEQGSDSTLADINWTKLEALAWLGRALDKLGNYDAAKFTYAKALALQPDFGWVKYVLLPQVEKEIK